MLLSDCITKMRRFLRDPDGLIWSDADLRYFWNEAQMEIVQKTGLLERVRCQYYPPKYTFAYLYEWERQHIDGDIYQALIINQITGAINSAVWESGYDLDNEIDLLRGGDFQNPFLSDDIMP